MVKIRLGAWNLLWAMMIWMGLVVTSISGDDMTQNHFFLLLLYGLPTTQTSQVKIVVWLLHQRVAAMIFDHQKIAERKPMRYSINSILYHKLIYWQEATYLSTCCRKISATSVSSVMMQSVWALQQRGGREEN